MTVNKALKISLFAHVITFVLLGGFPKGCHRGGSGDSEKQSKEQAQHKQEEKTEQILDKPSEKATEITIIEETGEQRAKRVEVARRKAIAECTPFFGGIGIEHSQFGVIGRVYEYYPAYDAGLKAGDIILSRISDIKGEIGTPVTITYKRGETINTVTFKRGRICTKDK